MSSTRRLIIAAVLFLVVQVINWTLEVETTHQLVAVMVAGGLSGGFLGHSFARWLIDKEKR